MIRNLSNKISYISGKIIGRDDAMKDKNMGSANIINLVNVRRYFKNKKYPFSPHRLSKRYESLDSEVYENQLYLYEERTRGMSYIYEKDLVRWVIHFSIGICTAFVGLTISFVISVVNAQKYNILSNMINEHTVEDSLHIPYLICIAFNSCCIVLTSILILFVEPLTAGSGIPSLKCYLNGVDIPNFLTLRVLLVKMITIICTITSGLPGGKEGPIIHLGASVGAILSEWKGPFRNEEVFLLKYFLNHHEKREFVCSGIACGVAVAFGGPMGGVLYCMEEGGANFLNPASTFRIFFSAVVSVFTMNSVWAVYYKTPMRNWGLINISDYVEFNYHMHEIPIFIIMGIFGGLSGSFWIYLNSKVLLFRKLYIEPSWVTCILESFFIGCVTTTTKFVCIYFSNACKPVKRASNFTHINCYLNEMNVMATFWLKTPENIMEYLLHHPYTITPYVIVPFGCCYYLLFCWSSGMTATMGIVVGALLVGSTWGRLVAQVLVQLETISHQSDVGKYALIGACAQLGGFVRSTISLTVIMMEATGSHKAGFPIFITLLFAKWTADLFNHSSYDCVIALFGIPYLNRESPPYVSHIMAKEIMSEPIITIFLIESVENILNTLKTTTHNGFPVVDKPKKNNKTNKIRGLILRKQLMILLKNKIFREYIPTWHGINSNIFSFTMPTFDGLNLSNNEMQFSIDLRPYMNPSPFTTLHTSPLSRLHNLFFIIGLRHLPVVDNENNVIGMITRKDIGKFKFYRNYKSIGIEELYWSDN